MAPHLFSGQETDYCTTWQGGTNSLGAAEPARGCSQPLLDVFSTPHL